MIQIKGTAISGWVEASWNNTVDIRLDKTSAETLLTDVVRVAADDLEVVPRGSGRRNRRAERVEREILAVARGRIARRLPS